MFKKVIEMLHFPRRVDAVSFRVAHVLVQNDDDVACGRFSDSSYFCNRHRVNLMIAYAFNVNSVIRAREMGTAAFACYFSI